MDGLIIRLLDDRTGNPGRWFWRAFGSIRPDLDRMIWCFTGQPWMGAPDDFDLNNSFLKCDGADRASVSLWRPGVLGRHAHQFGEEHIELWAIEPTRDDPAGLAAGYDRCWPDDEKQGDFIRQHARVWLSYFDSTCWEIYARKPGLLDRVRRDLEGKAGPMVHPSHADRRGQAFGAAGLSAVWQAMNGRF